MRFSKLRKQRWFILSATIFLLCTFSAALLSAQDSSGGEVRGVTAYGEFRGSDSSRQGQVLLWDTNVGYDFNRHVGLDLGLPVYMIRSTVDPTIAHPWEKHLGDPYFDVRLTFDNPTLDYATFFTISVPVSETGAFSTGRLGAEWYNHFSHAFGRFEPYVNAGIGDGILNTRLMSNPGPQKAYDGIQNFFLQPNGPITVADITHDHGETAFVRLNVNRFLYLEPGYVRSEQLHDNAATFRLGIDFRTMFDRSRSSSY
jgi:hypothetical protein